MGSAEQVTATAPPESEGSDRPKKLFGRAFYESMGSPKLILAPMVDQSEFAWRMLSRSFMTPEESKNLVAYSPMLHARLFADQPKYRESHFQPTRIALPATPDTNHTQTLQDGDMWLDGNPTIDRPLFVQFCANDPDALLAAAKHVQPFCDAVDLNLGCPQGIARKGHYGAFLQEDWDLIYRLINKLHLGLDIPVTAKMRILETKEKTLAYAKRILSAGASILTVHGRQREQKGHNTGLADWSVIRYLREQLPSETVLFANGNILQHEDIEQCMKATGVDGVMSAEGNLYDPTIFAKPPPVGQEGREYWRGRDGRGGYRADAVLRRYLDILYKYVLDKDAPQRKPLFLPADPVETKSEVQSKEDDETEQPPKKKRKLEQKKIQGKREPRTTSPNMSAVQPHLFHMLRPLITKHTNVRDALAQYHGGGIEALENILTLVEAAVKEGLLEYEKQSSEEQTPASNGTAVTSDPAVSSDDAIARCKRPYFICQPHIRPLPAEAFAKGSMQLSKKEKKKLEEKEAQEVAGATSEQHQSTSHPAIEMSEPAKADVALKDTAVAG